MTAVEATNSFIEKITISMRDHSKLKLITEDEYIQEVIDECMKYLAEVTQSA